MTWGSDIYALTSRVASEFNTLRSQLTAALAGKADDASVVKLSGSQTVGGAKTFTAAPSVPSPGSPGNPVRHDDGRLSDQRHPIDGSVTNNKVAGGAGIEESKLSLASDAAAGVASRRSLGTGAAQAAPGNHGHAGYATTDALSGYVPTSQRALIGGSAPSSGSGTWAPNAATASEHRRTVTGATTVNLPSGGVDTQLLRLWFLASGADRTVTFNSSYEVSQPVPGRVFTIPSGTWGEVLAVNRSGTWVLLAAYPQTITVPTHEHSAADITSGTVGYARLPVGSTTTTVAQGSRVQAIENRLPADGGLARRQSSGQTLSNGNNALTFATSVTTTTHATSDSSGITVQTAGVWYVEASIAISSNPGAFATLVWVVQGNDNINSPRIATIGALSHPSGGYPNMTTSTIIYLPAGARIGAGAWQNSGGNITNASGAASHFLAALIRPA